MGLYLNANNLYGWAMMQYLPTGGFRWIRDEYSLNKLKSQINNGLIKDDFFMVTYLNSKRGPIGTSL